MVSAKKFEHLKQGDQEVLRSLWKLSKKPENDSTKGFIVKEIKKESGLSERVIQQILKEMTNKLIGVYKPTNSEHPQTNPEHPQTNQKQPQTTPEHPQTTPVSYYPWINRKRITRGFRYSLHTEMFDWLSDQLEPQRNK